MKPGPRIDLNLLGVFEAIYSRGGVSAAARHLHLTQSAVSHSLARLRHALDDDLFVRAGNALVPTALARSMIEPVRDALNGVERAMVASTKFDPLTSTRAFRIALRQASEARFFASIVARAAMEAPGVTLASVDFRRAGVAQALARGEIDLAIDLPSEATARLRSITLQTDTLVVAVRRDHPRITGTLDLDTYLAADHVLASPRPSGPGLEDDALAAMNRTRRVAARCQNIWSAWQVVGATDMILTVLSSHARALAPLGDHRLLPLPFPVAARPLQLLWHETADRDPGNRWLRGLIAAQFDAA